MAVRCEGCDQTWSTGEPITPCRCVSDGGIALAAVFDAIILAIRVVHQRLRLAWSRRRSRVRLRKARTDPYRGISPASRFQIYVGDDSLEADSFGEIIAGMRALGCSDDAVINAALVTHATPRGGRITCKRSQARGLAWAATLTPPSSPTGVVAARREHFLD
jgi:hypothetical protein